MTTPKLERLQPIKPSAPAMETTVAATGGGAPTAPVPTLSSSQSLTLSQLAALGQACFGQTAENASTCKKHVQIGVFFDGTGNNLDADSPTFEHSNVARMFRAMLPNNATDGIYSIYVPGIGTLFPEIGDDGGGLMGPVLGGKGQDRLDWAFKELQKIISRVEPTCKEITMISLSVFGFSRGAALARAFVRDLLDAKQPYSKVQGKTIAWKRGNHPLEIRFLGIWDTVAAVGLGMGANNATTIRSGRRTWGNVARYASQGPIGALFGSDLKASTLAFVPKDVDPSPGTADGHSAWGNGMEIPGDLIQRCVHMIAGHEQRNSFPVDSASRGTVLPPNTEEMVFPGMHSDVGGGYRPGEQGRGTAAHATEENVQGAAQLLSQIPLRVMYDRAVSAGVPLRAMGGPKWTKENKDDFVVAPAMLERYTHYTAYARAQGLPLGDAMLAHMRAYFAWRFQHIRTGARSQTNAAITENEKIWNDDAHTLQARKDALNGRRTVLMREAMKHYDFKRNPNMLPNPATNSPEFNEIDAQVKAIDKELKEIQAKADTLPSRDTLVKSLAEYDAELLDDAISIHQEVSNHPEKRARLRPHYRNLLQAYEDEYCNGKGLRDPKVIALFDRHIHDSLADFGKDSTLPSDPRVVYIGGDVKLFYAAIDKVTDMPTEPAAAAVA